MLLFVGECMCVPTIKATITKTTTMARRTTFSEHNITTSEGLGSKLVTIGGEGGGGWENRPGGLPGGINGNKTT